MNNKVNYGFVGFLVLVGMILIVAFTYWMLKPTVEAQTKKYTIYFDESVLGLNIDAPVKYKGISIGKVSSMRINPQNPEQVDVTISIKNLSPIKTTTVAQLTAQGITGLTYINLMNSMKSLEIAQDLRVIGDETYPIIKTIPSFFNNFEKSLSNVSSKLTSTLGRTEELLGEENQKEMTLLLQKSASVMEKMDALLDAKTIKHLQNSAKNMDSFSAKLDNVMPDIDSFIVKSEKWQDDISGSFSSIMTSYKGIKSSMTEIKRAVSSGEFNVKEISSEIVPTMNATFLEMQELMVKFEDVLQQYENSPSDILYKKEEIKKAPGE